MNLKTIAPLTTGLTYSIGGGIQRATLFLFLLLFTLAASIAGASASTVVHYKVSSKGFSIGEVITTQRTSEEGGVATIHFETKTAIKASFLWMGYQQETIEKGTLLKGNLVNYSRKGSENGVAIDIEGRLENSSFRFDVRESGTTRSIVIPRSSYDNTTMECPEALLDFSVAPQITRRVLDVEKLAVVKREYRLVKNTQYAIGDRQFPCRVVDFSDQNKKARRWINWDGAAVVMYRQDGTGENSSYSVRATSVSK
ncbi:MAG TPA: hypothetical protein HPP97_12795 [Desulfuromonadales bacterium]|nr:hypothetical protein [Desulfuromonadales bacterium]